VWNYTQNIQMCQTTTWIFGEMLALYLYVINIERKKRLCDIVSQSCGTNHCQHKQEIRCSVVFSWNRTFALSKCYIITSRNIIVAETRVWSVIPCVKVVRFSVLLCLPDWFSLVHLGASGWGSYHGRWGFEAFSHRRACMLRGWTLERLNGLRYPPYSNDKLKWLRWTTSAYNSCSLM